VIDSGDSAARTAFISRHMAEAAIKKTSVADRLSGTPMNDVLTRWRTAVACAATELKEIPEHEARRRPASGKWSAAEILGSGSCLLRRR
jgi:hypothetical protein